MEHGDWKIKGPFPFAEQREVPSMTGGGQGETSCVVYASPQS